MLWFLKQSEHAIDGVLRPQTSYNQKPENSSAAVGCNFPKGTVGHIESDIGSSRYPTRRLPEVIGETRRSGCSSKCDNAPRKLGIPLRLEVSILLSQLLVRYSVQRYFIVSRESVARGLSTWRKRVVHASYTWFMDRGPYSDARRILGQWNVPNNTLVYYIGHID